MPGIAGVIGSMRPREAEAAVDEMLAAMTHELFYKKGKYVNEELGLYVGWLVHPDSFCDCMPVQSADGSTTIVLSGEVFTPEVRLQSLRKGDRKVTATDAGHLIHLYADLGDKFFEELNGSFCGIVASTKGRKLKLFNDRLGFEKLYFSENAENGTFYFASESKAILRVRPELRQFDWQGLAQFLNFGSTLEERTLYKGISLLPPASVWEFAPGSLVRKKSYFHRQDWKIDPNIGPETFQAMFDESFCRVLPRYFDGRLRPGISLTGGWDTRMIVASHRAAPGALPCFTFANATGDTVDVQLASRVAKLYQQEHAVLRLHPDFLDDFAKHAERTVYVSDGNADVCLTHEIYLNRQARHVSGARITGNFGSEVLRGVSTFKELPARSAWVNGELKSEVAKSKEQWIAGKDGDETAFAVFKEIPWKLAANFRLANSQLPTRAPFLDNEILRLACITPLSVRRASAFPAALVRAHSPQFLTIPTDRGEAGNTSALNRVFRKVFFEGTFKIDYLLNEGMPNYFPIVFDEPRLHRALTFGHKFLEYRRWFRGPLRRYTEEMLDNGNSYVSGMVGRKAVQQVLKEHASGAKNQLDVISVWLTMELINKSLLRAT
jgi:asparagine synthase (glutamine-hydrolysing)